MMKNKGFTLIELLVVIAIIGILAATVLASLSTARSKGRAASVQASISQMRAQAELQVDSGGAYPTTLCTGVSGAWTGDLGLLLTAVEDNGGTAVECNETSAAWAVSATLPGTGAGSYCSDSTGYSGVGALADGSDLACS